MEPTKNNATITSRRDIRKQGEQRHVKRYLALFGLSLLLAISALGAHHLMKNKKNEAAQPASMDLQQKKAQQEEQNQARQQALHQHITADQKALGNYEAEAVSEQGSNQTLLFLPESPLKGELSQQVQQLVTDTKEQFDLNTAQQKTLVGYVKCTTLGKALAYSPAVDLYLEKEDHWEVQPLTVGETIYASSETLTRPTLIDLFVSPNSFKAIRPFIKQVILNTATAADSSQLFDQVTKFPPIEIDQVVLDYSPEQVTFALPENELKLEKLTLNFTDILPCIDPGFVNPELVAAQGQPPLEANKKYIALTFDDGPNPLTTPRLLDILSEKEVQATFFVLGQNVVQHPDIVRRAIAEGHDIASHSYSHPKLTALAPEAIMAEVNNTDRAIFEATGALPSKFRPPYGAVNQQAADIIGRPIIQWSVDSEDWKSKNTKKIIRRVKETSFPNSIILMHDIHPETVDAVPQIIDDLRAEGYEFIAPDRLLGNNLEINQLYYGNKATPVG